MLMSVVLMPAVSSQDSSSADAVEKHTVVYHPLMEGVDVSSLGLERGYNQFDSTGTGVAVPGSVTVEYCGSIVSTEYNPQVWAGTFNPVSGTSANWFAINDSGYPYRGGYSNYGEGRTVVFTGWVYAVFDSSGAITGYTDTRYPGEVLSESEMAAATRDGAIHVYATWGKMVNFTDSIRDVGAAGWKAGGDAFTNIVKVTEGILSRATRDGGGFTLRGNTVRIAEVGNSTDLNQDVIIDSITISGSHNANHGDQDGGIFADGNVLIIGTGVYSEGTDLLSDYTQLFGGGRGGSVRSEETRVPFGGGGTAEILGTMMIVHSGTFANIVAGSQNGNVEGSTYLVVKDVSVLDTLIGGNGGGNGTGNTIHGSSYVYATGLDMRGDFYEESYIDPGFQPDGPKLTESTILTGGSNNGTITGDTHVYLSGDSLTWDVQAGGRRGDSSVQTAYAEVSGFAQVRHVLCGSITDGIKDGGNKASVKSTSLTVKDGARVASVFGAGYDTYYSANYASMLDGGEISISIEGGTVGYVYGGGYRGTIGTPDYPISAISISISGGKVLNDVYGGGRGGLDKVLHYVDRPAHSESMNDSTGFSAVFTDRIAIEVTGGEIGGSVFGGGESVPLISKYNGYDLSDQNNDILNDGRISIDGMRVASVDCNNISISVSGGSVGGDVYGAGRGVDTSDTVTVDGTEYHSSAFIMAMGDDGMVRIPWVQGTGGTTAVGSTSDSYRYFNYASLTGNVSIELKEASVGGSVYGGGMFGRTGSHLNVNGPNITGSVSGYTVRIEAGNGTRIGGDLFAGGYGRDGGLSTNLQTRTVVVDGASVGGSVYGGSRYGNDNCISGSDHSGFRQGNAYVYVRSGDVASGHSGNVYGGGFLGYSYMNTGVYIGVPALDGTNAPSSKELKVGSVYGGASVGETSDFSEDSLVTGNTSVVLGSLNAGGTESPYSVFSVTGDVFGEGDYCAVDGSTSVEFRGFTQGSSLLSVQKADTLTIRGSSISIVGDVSGESTDASAKLSLNLIGDLILIKDDAWGPSSLELQAAASEISGYGSLEADGTVGDVPDFSRPVSLNSITMQNGMMLSILGTDNAGLAENDIRGFTLIDNGGSTYYGAFAMGTTKRVQSGSTGFYVRDGDGYVLSQEAPFRIGGNDVTMWYISGVYKVESTVVLEDGASPSKEFELLAPKTVSGSKMQFVGGYVNQNTPESLRLVDRLDETQGGRDFLMMVGTKTGEGYLGIGGGGVAAMPSASTEFEGTGIRIGMKVSTNPGFETTGYVGTVILHMVETIGSIPINAFDAEISIYLRMDMSSHTGTIQHGIVMRENDGGTGYSGSTDVYLPVLPGNGIADYRISVGTYTDGVWTPGSVPEGGILSVSTVPTNLNKNGWQSVVSNDLRTLDVSTEGGMSLGSGGVFAPVLSFVYTHPDTEGRFDAITLTLWLSEEETGALKAVYTIVLTPEEADLRDVSFYDRILEYDAANGTVEWSVYGKPVLSIKVEFGSRLDTLYVAVSEKFVNWAPSGTADDYVDTVRNGQLYSEDILLRSDGIVMTGSKDYIDDQVVESGYRTYTLEGFIDLYIGKKPSTEYGESEPFDYTSNPRLYDTSSCLSLFNFGSKITNDSTIFASYGIMMTIVPFTDNNDPDAPGKEYSVMPASFLLGLPGESVNLNAIYETLSITAGYAAPDDGDTWWLKGTAGLEPISGGTFTPRADVTVYLHLELAVYEISLIVNGQPMQMGPGYSLSVNGAPAKTSEAHYGDEASLVFQWGAGYHIGSITGVSAGEQFNAFNIESSEGENTVSFSMPPGDLVITVTMTDKNTVTVNLPLDGTSDNGLFGVELKDTEDGLRIVLVESLNRKTAVLETSSVTASVTGTTTHGKGSFLVSAYCGDKPLFVLKESTGAVVDLSDMGTSITISLYVSVKWKLTIDGDGYDVTRYALADPREGTRSQTQDPTIYTDDVPCPYVLTGDVLLAVSNGDSTLEDLKSTNLELSPVSLQGRLMYTFAGAGNPRLYDPSFTVILSVEVTFYVAGEKVTVHNTGWQPKGEVTVERGGVVENITVSLSDGILKGSTPMENGVYTLRVSYEGFPETSLNLVLSSSNVEEKFELQATEYTLEIKNTAEVTQPVEQKWYVNNIGTIASISGYPDASAWFVSPNQDMSGSQRIGPDSALSVQMFG